VRDPAKRVLAIKQISATVGGQAGIQVETEENRMEQSVEKIIERNLLEVFNGRDADSRRAPIDELRNKDGVFIDPGGVHEGVENIHATAELLFTQFEGYVFSARGPGQSLHGVGRFPWSYGPPDDPQRMMALTLV
jgi:hypothetical protein